MVCKGINIRLWSSKPCKRFDFASFNDGDYDKSVAEQKNAENITSVLYPNGTCVKVLTYDTSDSCAAWQITIWLERSFA